MVPSIFLSVIAQNLQDNCPAATDVDKAAPLIGAVAFIRRDDSSLNEYIRFHVCAVDEVLRATTGDHWTTL